MPAERVSLALFARAPIAGRTKTRLIPALGAEGAAALARAFLHDTLSRVAELDADATIWAASEHDRAALSGEVALPIAVQPEGDLGARMEVALRDGIERAGRALILGTDAPTLPLGHLRAAIEALDRAEVVLGPAADGGFWVIGARAPLALGPGVRWSSRHALADTIALVQQDGRTVERIAPWYDVDTSADLALLRAHLALRPGAAPRTAAALACFDPPVKPQ
jgi:rSAM/selenodomain-associated transferase 1